MPDTAAAATLDALLSLVLGSREGAHNRFSVEGLAVAPVTGGGIEFSAATVELASLRVASGPFLLEVDRLALRDVRGQLRVDAGAPRLQALQAAQAELSGARLQGPLLLPKGAAEGDGWLLEPLATASGTVRAKIVDAQLLFDANVTLPLQDGRIDFGDATVEHVGPDSRMGVSRLGVYVDAPNGRSYLYQFPSTPVAGVTFEKRGALLGPWVTDRGGLELQPFLEWLLRQPGAAQGEGITPQSRLLLDRTAVSGEVQLGQGRVAVAGLQADLAGRAAGSNLVRLHSGAAGLGVGMDIDTLAILRSALQGAAARLETGAITGTVQFQVQPETHQARFSLVAPALRVTDLRVSFVSQVKA